jgi:hypothetical protein
VIHLDHICLGVRNIYEGAHRLREETGLDSYNGGFFPGSGLANRIVPLPGDVYFEVESVVDATDASASPIAPWFLEATATEDSWMFWALRADTVAELHEIADRVGGTVREGPQSPVRIRPDGVVLRAALAPSGSVGLWGRGLPNWYCHEDMARHPARTTVKHRRRVSGVAWMEVGGDPAEMEAHVGPEVFARLPLRFCDGAGGLYAVGLSTDDGDEIVIRKRSAASLLGGA